MHAADDAAATHDALHAARLLCSVTNVAADSGAMEGALRALYYPPLQLNFSVKRHTADVSDASDEGAGQRAESACEADRSLA